MFYDFFNLFFFFCETEQMNIQLICDWDDNAKANGLRFVQRKSIENKLLKWFHKVMKTEFVRWWRRHRICRLFVWKNNWFTQKIIMNSELSSYCQLFLIFLIFGWLGWSKIFFNDLSHKLTFTMWYDERLFSIWLNVC